jgi:hypothetical protein
MERSTAADVVLLTGVGKQKCKVSSTLNNSSQYSYKHMFDDDGSKCWNSDQGSPQYILLNFGRNVSISSLHIVFQGGFVPTEIGVECADNTESMQSIRVFYPSDSNEPQIFDLENRTETSIIKLNFPSSTDFYGRVTIYSLQVCYIPTSPLYILASIYILLYVLGIWI